MVKGKWERRTYLNRGTLWQGDLMAVEPNRRGGLNGERDIMVKGASMAKKLNGA